MESGHSLEPPIDDSEQGEDPPEAGSLPLTGEEAVPSAHPAAGELPHLSTVLGALPAGVPAKQTRDLNDAVHRILIVGLVASTVLLLVGLALDAIDSRSLPAAVAPPAEAVSRALALRPSGFLSLGLLVLLATPIVRVIGSIVVFIWERDWRYVAITLFVLLVIVVSIVLGQE